MFCHLIYLFFNFLPLSMLFWAFVMEMGLNSLSATEAWTQKQPPHSCLRSLRRPPDLWPLGNQHFRPSFVKRARGWVCAWPLSLALLTYKLVFAPLKKTLIYPSYAETADLSLISHIYAAFSAHPRHHHQCRLREQWEKPRADNRANTKASLIWGHACCRQLQHMKAQDGMSEGGGGED